MVIPTTESTLRMTLMQLSETKLELTTVTEQRDMLIEVIKAASVLIAAKGRHNTMLAYNGLRDALQSLNPDHTVAANDMIAAAKGGSDEIPR